MKHRLALEMAVAFSLIMIIDLPRTWAVLGEPVSAVETDRVALGGQLSMIQAQLYTIQEITTSELVVREYVSRDTVFAVAWRGRRPLNLVSLLGSYFQEYQEAAVAAASNGPRMHGMTRIQGTPCRGRSGRSSGRYTRKSLYPLTPPFGSDKRDDPMMLRGCRSVLFGVAVTVLLGCGNSGSSGPSSPSGPSGPNVLAITIDPSSAAVCTFANQLCTQVTICQPGTSHCQTIADVLVGTGSSGLRIFASAVMITLPSSNLGECMYFGGATDWGRVHTVDVILGKEPAVSVPIQVIDPTFAGQYTSAGQPASNICGVAVVDSSPVQAGFNGILGIGLFPFDGGAYYNCASLPCRAVAVSASQQVQNPIGLLPVDNNGVIVALPSVPASGSPSVTGSLILGIGTASNNQPSGVTVLPTDSSGQIVTHFHPSPGVSTPETGIFDSGSSAMFFLSDSSLSIPLCPGNLSFLYCPASPVTFSATNTELSGSPASVVSFQIANPMALLSSGNAAISNMGGPTFSTGLFDWGLPFFFGRTVYVGLSGKTSVLGTGPFWAY